MNIFKWADEKVKKLNLIDVKMLAIIGVCIGLILAKLIPSILDISVWWFVVIGVLLLVKVYYVLLFKK